MSWTISSSWQAMVLGSKTVMSAASPGASRPRSGMPKISAGRARDEAHRGLERQGLALAHPVAEELARLARLRELVMWAPASERPSTARRMREDLGHRAGVGVHGGRLELGAEIVRERQVEEGVDHVLARCPAPARPRCWPVKCCSSGLTTRLIRSGTTSPLKSAVRRTFSRNSARKAGSARMRAPLGRAWPRARGATPCSVRTRSRS